MRQKQFLYRAAAELERNPFYLQPHQHPMFPLFTLNSAVKPGSFSPVGSVYSLLPGTSKTPGQQPLGTPTVSSQASSTTVLQPASSIPPAPPVSVAGSPRPTYPAQFYPTFMKYPFSPTTGLLSPWNTGGLASVAGSGGRNLGGVAAPTVGMGSPGSLQTPTLSGALAASTPRETNESGASQSGDRGRLSRDSSRAQLGQQQQQKAAVTWPQSPQTMFAAPSAGLQRQVMSPRTGIDSMQPSLSYFHPPLSPMMLAWSPYNNSVSSCPSFSSSSGSTEGSSKRYALSEYHVGPQRPLSEKYCGTDSRSEGANNSGRNTPNYSSGDDSTGRSNMALSGEVKLVQNSVSDAPHSPQGEERECVTVDGAVGQAGTSLYSSLGPLSNSQPLSVGSNSQVRKNDEFVGVLVS